jgi:hypothetical protein
MMNIVTNIIMTFELAKDIIKQIHMMKNDKMGNLFRKENKNEFS